MKTAIICVVLFQLTSMFHYCKNSIGSLFCIIKKHKLPFRIPVFPLFLVAHFFILPSFKRKEKQIPKQNQKKNVLLSTV